MTKTPGKQAEKQKNNVRRLLKHGQLKQAANHCSRLCADNPADAEAFYLLGYIYSHAGKYQDAINAYSKSLQIQPRASVTYSGLGTACNALGDYINAEKSFRTALSLQPGNADALMQLAYCLQRQHKLDEAETCLQQVLANNPVSADALRSIGEIRHYREQYVDAANYYIRALKIDGNQALIHFRLGQCLHRLGKHTDAISHYETATAIDPKFIDAYINLGGAYLLDGNPDKARTAFRKVQEIDPDNLDAILGLVETSELDGDLQDAFDRMQPLLRQGVESPDLASLYVKICRHFDCCEDAIRYAEHLLQNASLGISKERHLRYLLGKLLDRLGDFDTAFEHYRRANSLRAENFIPAEHIGTIDALTKVFSWQFFTSAPRATVRSSRPIFIVGMPRSGTSLTEQILASHPDVYGAGELMEIGNIVQSIPERPDQIFPYNLGHINQEMLNGLAQGYLDHLEKLAPDAKRITDKMPQNFLYLGFIALAFPDARIIHCKRDARDTCLSIYFQNFNDSHRYASNLEHIGIYYRQYEKLMQHFQGILGVPILEIHYEDLVSRQEEMTRKLVNFTGLEWDDRCLEFHKTSRFVATSSYDQVRQTMYTRSLDRWKNYSKHLEPLFRALGDNEAAIPYT